MTRRITGTQHDTTSEPDATDTVSNSPALHTSRKGFLRGGALAAGIGAAGAAGVLGPATPAQARPGVDPNPRARRPEITRLATLTGPGITTRFRMEATDLGIPAVAPDGRILLIFGDTFEGAKVGAGFWRSPVGLYADPNVKLKKGLRWTGAVGGEIAEQLVEYSHDGPLSTILPADVITIGDTMYLWVMLNAGLGKVTGTEIWTSTDSGETWERTAEMFAPDHLDGFSQQCTWALNETDGHVYALTTGFQRDKEVILQRVPKESILDPEAYEVYGTDGWGVGDPVHVIGGHVGEMCLRVVDDKWVLTYFNAGLYRVDCLVFDSAEKLTEPPLFADTLFWGCNWGREDDERVAQLYGPYILPGSTLDDMHVALSQWQTGPDWPYHVQQYRVQGIGREIAAL